MGSRSKGRSASAERAGRVDRHRWQLDALEDRVGDLISVERVAVVRIACIAAETGARMQRDGVSVDPLTWLLTPLALFAGRPPIEACMKREACAQVILLHGLGLPLDADAELLASFTQAGSASSPQEAASA